MILVTGATGNVGSAALEKLVDTGQQVRVLARDPAKLEKLSGKIGRWSSSSWGAKRGRSINGSRPM